MRYLFLLSLAGCITALPDVDEPCGDWPEPGLYRMKLDDEPRNPLVYVPASTGPRPAIFSLHGGGGDAQTMREVVQLTRLADNEGAVLVFPNGRGNLFGGGVWRAGDCCGPSSNDNSDVAYLDRVAEELGERVCVDKVLAAGFSNGGMMAMRWGCESEAVTAVLSAGAALMLDTCESPTPIRHYHGLDDQNIPSEGGRGTEGRLNLDWPSVDQTMASFKSANQCSDDPIEVTTTGDTTCTTWDCQAPTTLCLIEGWEHKWPGGRNASNNDSDLGANSWAWFETEILGESPEEPADPPDTGAPPDTADTAN